jgi:hypothetical protein
MVVYFAFINVQNQKKIRREDLYESNQMIFLKSQTNIYTLAQSDALALVKQCHLITLALIQVPGITPS